MITVHSRTLSTLIIDNREHDKEDNKEDNNLLYLHPIIPPRSPKDMRILYLTSLLIPFKDVQYQEKKKVGREKKRTKIESEQRVKVEEKEKIKSAIGNVIKTGVKVRYRIVMITNIITMAVIN